MERETSAGSRRMDYESRKDSRPRIREAGRAVESHRIQRRQVGATRTGCRHEVHGHHVKAPRWICHVRLQSEFVQRWGGDAIQARCSERISGRVPEARNAFGLLLLAT